MTILDPAGHSRLYPGETTLADLQDPSFQAGPRHVEDPVRKIDGNAIDTHSSGNDEPTRLRCGGRERGQFDHRREMDRLSMLHMDHRSIVGYLMALEDRIERSL